MAHLTDAQVLELEVLAHQKLSLAHQHLVTALQLQTMLRRNRDSSGASPGAAPTPTAAAMPLVAQSAIHGDPSSAGPGLADTNRLSIDAVQSIFDEFDTDKSGSIDAAEFRVVAYALGEVLTKEEATAAMSVLDANKNGTIAFDEFFLWINAPRSAEDRTQKGVGSAILKAKLAARYYRKLAENGVEKLRSRLPGAKPATPGDSSANVDINIGSPNGAITAELSQKAGDGNVNAALFLTLKDGAQEGRIKTVLSVLTDALTMAPLAQVPGYVSHSLEVVEYRGGRAIRFVVVNAMNPLALAEGQFGFSPSLIQLNAMVSLGASLQSLLDGTATLKDLFKLRVQLNAVAPNRAKVVLRELLMLNAGRVEAFGAAALLSSHKEFNLILEFDDIMHAVNELCGTMGDAEAEKVRFFNRMVNANLSGLRVVLNAAVAMGYNMLSDMVDGLPPFAARFLAEYDAFQSTLNGIGGLQLNFGAHGYELALTGLNVFSLLPTKAELGTAKQLPRSPMDAAQILDGPLLELWHQFQGFHC
jgi:hypothetical protein